MCVSCRREPAPGKTRCHFHVSKNRDGQYRHRYGLSLTQVDALFEANPACQLCGSQKGLVIDHDHATGRVRGVLCTRCNVSIGGLGDTPEGLKRALAYLEGDNR